MKIVPFPDSEKDAFIHWKWHIDTFPLIVLGNINLDMTFLSLLKSEKLQTVNTLRLRQNGRHFADGIFKCIFLNEKVWISIVKVCS